MPALLDIATSTPEGIGALLGSLGTLVTFAAYLARRHMKKNEHAMQSVPATVTPPSNPFASPPPTDPQLIHRLDNITRDGLDVSRRLDELRRLVDATKSDQERAAIATNMLKDRLVLELECERQKVASLLAAQDEAEKRIAQLEAEKLDLEARIPTPLRPPRRQE